MRIDTIQNNNENTFLAHSYYLEPGIMFSVPIKQFTLAINFGYFKEFLRSDFKMVKDSQNGIAVNKNFSDADIWDGFRLGFTVSFALPARARKLDHI